jgi:hypothetical protein
MMAKIEADRLRIQILVNPERWRVIKDPYRMGM